ncbi:hypothetical protein EFM26_09565 [Limosilactobacillus fermentum]|uniref:lipocalin/fatty acid-binding family protein n=1 Tax=Limosilactobacillus fermentum TaxID=1613 RepID=UPI0021A69021|nr:lipocalin/fatty acid-binding family protein [Limosilactobacillus fermentum]MCT2870406.1 hypothetical protein [Limosilactobacillus fermentum]MCT2918738.1 hypothetical protein [Limosilactobacillus fermentum]
MGNSKRASISFAINRTNSEKHLSNKAQQTIRNSANNSSQSKSQSIRGTFVSWKDGASIKFNSDGTGRYVFADPVNADTDDNFTWKSVDANKVEIDMHDEDVASSVIAEFRGV